MKINKFIWILALVLIISVPGVFAATGIFGNAYFILATNIAVVWIILFVIASFIPAKDNKVKVILWIATFAIAVLIAWNFGRGDQYIWWYGGLASFFEWKIVINTIIIAGVSYFGLGLLGVNPPTTPGKIGMVVLVIMISGLIAHNIGNTWLWEDNNVKGLYKYLLGPREEITDATGKKTTIGGILKPEGPEYRLIIFGVSALVFAWFLIGFLNITTGGNKLSIAMAIIIAASLAHRGESLDMVRRMAEVLSFLIVLKQIPPDIFAGLLGGLGTGLRYLVAGLLVGWIFCTAFGTSAIGEIMSPVISLIPGASALGIDFCPAKECVTDAACSTGKICGPEKKCVAKTGPTTGLPKGRGAPGVPDRPWWKLW